jgi:hypothetical protein
VRTLCRRHRWLGAAATCLLLVVAGGAGAAVADADSGVTVNVKVPPGSFPPPPIEVSIGQMIANEDVSELMTTNTYIGFGGPPGKTATLTLYGQVGGLSFARLLEMAQVAPTDLVPGPGAVTISASGDPNPADTLILSSQEVLTGFDDPCESPPAAGCPSVDTTPNFAVMQPGDGGSVQVQRPLRRLPEVGGEPLPDENGDPTLQTCTTCPLSVTFNTLGNVLFVNAPSQSATTIPDHGSVTFGPPTSVTLNGSPDPNLPFTYSWDFGDGQTGTGSSPTHEYDIPGSHAILVTVTDSAGHSGVGHEIMVQVNPPPPPPPPTTTTPKPPPTTPTKPPPHPTPTTPAPPLQQPSPPTSGVVVHPAPPTGQTNKPGGGGATLHLATGGSGGGSGGGNGGGHGSGSGGGASTGAAGGTGHSGQGVAQGGVNGGQSQQPGGTGSTPNGSTTGSAQPGSTQPSKAKGLVGVLISPSGGAPSSAGSALSSAAAAARALAGGGKSAGASWLWWVLGCLALVGVMSGRAVVEFEPNAPYRALRRRLRKR